MVALVNIDITLRFREPGVSPAMSQWSVGLLWSCVAGGVHIFSFLYLIIFNFFLEPSGTRIVFLFTISWWTDSTRGIAAMK
ncbi:unnamed protein product [Onchocerca flexuosa]|uniref:7TM_GPCR_Srx domain-containing protein n=1 Tax=Onchocerca flexuosa TaxID=387005 RepID=A0A183H949_9BILA|nr:unnamed protein product [Onchocerca flexuosa]